jgi:hypothetical protein
MYGAIVSLKMADTPEFESVGSPSVQTCNNETVEFSALAKFIKSCNIFKS